MSVWPSGSEAFFWLIVSCGHLEIREHRRHWAWRDGSFLEGMGGGYVMALDICGCDIPPLLYLAGLMVWFLMFYEGWNAHARCG